jgi:hypothetical protein
MSLILGFQGRKLIRDITIKDSALAVISPGTNDVVRIKIGRIGQTPLLDLDSAVASAGGSTIAKNTPSAGINRVQISQVDMSTLKPGVYSFEVALVDNADAQAIKTVDHQIFVVRSTMAGDVGLV